MEPTPAGQVCPLRRWGRDRARIRAMCRSRRLDQLNHEGHRVRPGQLHRQPICAGPQPYPRVVRLVFHQQGDALDVSSATGSTVSISVNACNGDWWTLDSTHRARRIGPFLASLLFSPRHLHRRAPAPVQRERPRPVPDWRRAGMQRADRLAQADGQAGHDGRHATPAPQARSDVVKRHRIAEQRHRASPGRSRTRPRWPGPGRAAGAWTGCGRRGSSRSPR